MLGETDNEFQDSYYDLNSNCKDEIPKQHSAGKQRKTTNNISFKL
jgi:hypothetical protein